jgi:ABC-type protease/lipase transport system fused ATPase/permease subunit
MRSLLAPFKRHLTYAALFSFVLNLMLLAPAVYMMQVFDRVLSSRHMETLVALTILTVAALTVMFLLEVVRARILTEIAVMFDRRFGSALVPSF